MVTSGFPTPSKTSLLGRSYVVIVTSYDVPPFMMVNSDPRPIGSALRSSALATRLFQRRSLRASAIESNTVSGGHSTVVVASTRMAQPYTGWSPRPRSPDRGGGPRSNHGDDPPLRTAFSRPALPG